MPMPRNKGSNFTHNSDFLSINFGFMFSVKLLGIKWNCRFYFLFFSQFANVLLIDRLDEADR